jgi:hypothetical protein
MKLLFCVVLQFFTLIGFSEALPPIYLPSPIPVAASPSVTYDASYLVRMVVLEPNKHGSQQIVLVLRPYSSAAKAVYPDATKDSVVRIEDVMTEAARSSAFGQAMGAVLTVASLEFQEQTIKKQIAKLTDDDAGLPALQEQLKDVDKLLGVAGTPELKGKK